VTEQEFSSHALQHSGKSAALRLAELVVVTTRTTPLQWIAPEKRRW
jgi:hypothetical protein